MSLEIDFKAVWQRGDKFNQYVSVVEIYLKWCNSMAIN